jgi:hypothetical protein
MSKLIINGYKKIEGLRFGDWECSMTTETPEIYTFLFDFVPQDEFTTHQDVFNLIIIYRNYQNPDGFKMEVNFNIVRNNKYTETFEKVKERWVYAYELITLEKFKKIIETLLKNSV